MQHKQVHAVDLMKFVCAILVIVVHTYPFYEAFPDVGFISSNILGRIIIPFFFISAGYFFEIGTTSKGEDYFKRYMKRLVKLYLIWSAICLPAGILMLNRLIDLQGFQWIFALLAGVFYAGTYYHLWYMAALIFALYLCHAWLKKFRLRSLLIVGFILFCFGCLETYYAAFQNWGFIQPVDTYFSIFVTTRNGLFFGIIYVALGIAIARENLDTKIKHSLAKSILFFVLLFIEAQVVRYFGWAKDYNMYFMAIPFIYYWFSWLLNARCPWNLDYKAMREYSTIIYFSHGMFLEYVPFLLGTQYAYLYDLGWFRFLSVFILTMIASYLIRHYVKWLK